MLLGNRGQGARMHWRGVQSRIKGDASRGVLAGTRCSVYSFLQEWGVPSLLGWGTDDNSKAGSDGRILPLKLLKPLVPHHLRRAPQAMWLVDPSRHPGYQCWDSPRCTFKRASPCDLSLR